jgi:hypothetical protein
MESVARQIQRELGMWSGVTWKRTAAEWFSFISDDESLVISTETEWPIFHSPFVSERNSSPNAKWICTTFILRPGGRLTTYMDKVDVGAAPRWSRKQERSSLQVVSVGKRPQGESFGDGCELAATGNSLCLEPIFEDAPHGRYKR